MISVFRIVTLSFETFESSSALSGQKMRDKKMHFRESTWAPEEIKPTRDKF